MKSFIKHYFWFLKESGKFLDKNIFRIIGEGGLKKARIFAKDMCVWDKMTTEQRENWYLTADRTIEI